MSRRKIESLSSVVLNEDLRQTDSQSERKSVFERLGRIKRTNDVRRVVSLNDYKESDLRFKVRRKRTNACVSPNGCVSPQTQTQTTANTSNTSTHSRNEDKFDTKVKSLVLNPNTRSESPTNHTQSVTSSSNTCPLKRTLPLNKWEDDIDDEVLERKRLQLQKELQELEKSGTLEQQKSDCLPLTVTLSHIISRSSSALSSESGSYSSSIKSFSKTESSCSSNADKKTNIKSSNREHIDSNKSISEKKRHVSSSISRKTSSNLDDSSHKSSKKSNEVKFDRHGNIRVSLDEQERQKRLRAERFAADNHLNQIDVKKKSNSIESKGNTSRDRSNSPPAKRSRESISNEKSNSDALKVERIDGNRREDFKSKSDSRSSKYEFSPRSRSSETTDSLKPKHNESQHKGSERSRRSSLLSVSPNYRERRDNSRDSRFSDRDNMSVTSRHDVRKSQTYSRDQSPTHSTHSKISRDRDSSISSDFSRSKSERISIQSHHRSTHSKNIEIKNIEPKVNDPIIEEMSPISADSSIPDIEIDSPKVDSKFIDQKEDETLITNRFEVKTEDESDDDFSEWSEGEDDLLLKNDGFETLDEIKNISETSQEKDLWNEEKSDIKCKTNSGDSYLSYSKDDELEAISDDEFDAIIGESEPIIVSNIDSKKLSSSRQMLDSLEIDWGSLVSEPKTKLEYISGSARKRFTPASVLMRIGFSQTFAGPLITQKIVNFCQNELKEDFVPFRHPMAAVHSLISERIKERRYLFGVDTHSNALSGRKDLQIRKILNKSSFKLFDSNSTTTSANDLSVLSTNDSESVSTNIQCF